MPALSVSVDGVPLATVNTDGYDLLDIRVSGTVIDEEMAALRVSGASYPEGGEPLHLTWIDELPLQPGQVVEVSLLAAGTTSHRGLPFEELFPGEPPSEQVDFKLTAEMIADLRSRPRLREKYSFRLLSAKGIASEHQTSPNDHAFAFSLIWNSFHPERARVALHSYSIDDIGSESRGPMNYHFEERVHVGEMVRFQLAA